MPASNPEPRPSIWRLGLLGRIAAALALVAVVPLAFAVAGLAGANREALLEQLLRTHTVAARTAADALDAFLAARRSLAASLLLAPELAADPTSPAAQTRLRDSLASWSEAGIVAAALHDADGALLVKVQQKGRGELAERLLGGAAGGATLLAVIDQHPWLRLELPVPGSTAALRLAVDAQPLLEVLSPEELGEQAHLLLLDRGGEPLLGGAAEVAALPAALREAALVAKLSGTGRFRDAAGRELVGAWSSADAGQWVVISTQPAAIAEAAARRMTRRAAAAGALALALAALLAGLAYRGLVKPLRVLLAAQRRVAGLSSTAAAGSETAQLQSAMTALERNARDREALDEVFLGRYQVIEILGSGGMGTVFRGWDPRLQRPVALKTIHLEGQSTRNAEETLSSIGKLLAEAVAAAQIVHPHVVAIYDAEQVESIAYVAMEYVDGLGLDRYLEERGRLSWREAVPLGQAIAEGLAAAHGRDLMHRDIKPGNVLLGHDGSIKIADFGLAQFLSQRREKPGMVVGTPGFMAPETLQGKPYTFWSDLFALGVVLCRAVRGSYPFQGRQLRDIVGATLNQPAPRPEEFEPEVPRAFAELIAGLLEKNPERRLGPARAVAERLAELGRVHGLSWQLDFERATRPIHANEVFHSLALPVAPAARPAAERAAR